MTSTTSVPAGAADTTTEPSSDDASVPPIVIVGKALEDQGVKRFDPKAFLLGFLIGCSWNEIKTSKDREEKLLWHVEQLYARKRKT